MNPYIALTLSIVFASANNILLHLFGNKGLRGIGDALLFNAASSGVWIIILGACALTVPGEFSLETVLWGVLYGAVTAAFLFSKMQALASGPISVTSLVGCSSMLISTGVGIIFWRESVSIPQLVGVALLIAALALTVSPKNSEAKRSWKYWCAVFFLCGGAVGIIFKLHQSSDAAAEIDRMMLVAAITSAALLTFMAFAVSARRGERPKLPPRGILYALGCGAVSCAYNRLNIWTSGQLPSVVFFPVFNGSLIFITALAGVVLFREKLKPAQLVGILIGACALTLISGLFG